MCRFSFMCFWSEQLLSRYKWYPYTVYMYMLLFLENQHVNDYSDWMIRILLLTAPFAGEWSCP